MASQQNTPRLRDLTLIIAAAAECGIHVNTLRSAVERGDVPSWTTRCGTPLVRLRDVKAFQKHPPKRGRPPKAARQR